MNWLQPKLNLRVAQKQILTPGLVQMVSVLALNRLELREMINQEIMANPVLDEATEDDGVTAESYTDEAFLKKETEKVPEVTPAHIARRHAGALQNRNRPQSHSEIQSSGSLHIVDSQD